MKYLFYASNLNQPEIKKMKKFSFSLLKKIKRVSFPFLRTASPKKTNILTFNKYLQLASQLNNFALRSKTLRIYQLIKELL